MKHLFFSFLVVVMTLSSILSPGTALAQSTPGPWTWTDISSRISIRTNRPIWTIAYARGNWFYSDGLDLVSLGQVYRDNGFIQTNITADIRSAGLTRVDDIVSNGKTVLFLQDLVRFDNHVRIVAYQNGQYLNLSQSVQNVLSSNEGISQIVGQGGNWRIVTTEGRLLGWDGSSANPFEISLPSVIIDVWNRYKSTPSYKQRMLYNPNDAYTLAPVKIQPMNHSEWVIQVVDELALTHNAYGTTWHEPLTRFYRIQQNNSVETTPMLELASGDMLASNGTDILGVEHGSSIRPYFSIFSLSSSGKKHVHSEPLVNFYAGGVQLRVTWNGKSWMVLSVAGSSRAAYRFDPQNPVSALSEARFEVRDYLFALASDQNGHMLLGGAVSNTDVAGPSSPLTAKLVMVTEDVDMPICWAQ